MPALAKPGEAVASAGLVAALPDVERDRPALPGSRTIEGGQQPIDRCSMVLDEGAPAQMLAGGGASPGNRRR